MSKSGEEFKTFLERVLPWLILAILLFYTFINFFERPYGIEWSTAGTITSVFVAPPAASLQVGDQLVQVGSLPWDAFHADLRKNLFEGFNPGDVVPVVVERAGRTITIPWKLPGFTVGALLAPLTGQWFLAYFFWLAGTLTMLLLRPRDERWWLLSAFDFLTAIWIIAGSGPSNYHQWFSALVLRMGVWLSLPIYLHLHWEFPRPLGKLSPSLIRIVYGLTLAAVIAQGFQVLSQSLYFFAFLLAVGGSLILLVFHFFRQREARREVRLFAVVIFCALVPAVLLAFAGTVTRGSISVFSTLVLISFAALPYAYLYSAYRRQLGGLEVRVNRLISAFFFVLLVGLAEVPLLILADRLFNSLDDYLILGEMAVLMTSILAIWVFPRFQNFVERNWLGISLSTKNLQEVYSARITTSKTIADLLDVLRDEILPSLLVRQFAFYQYEAGEPKALITLGVEDGMLDGDGIPDLLDQTASDLRPPFGRGGPGSWIRFTLPLEIGGRLLGFWSFGRRDPDDLYSQAEISILQSLANQTAIALSNILQTERLKSLYAADVNRYEEERLHLAMDLHDHVLGEMAALLINLDESTRSPKFRQAYDGLTQRLREIVSDLRPPMLAYGLKPALEGLADHLMEQSKDTIDIFVNLWGEDQRYPPNLEHHLFRMVQEACQNAARHSGSKKIVISGSLDRKNIDLDIMDQGAGFEWSDKLELSSLLSSKHFGLAGMIERAEMIGAKVSIRSAPGEGTRVQIRWNSDQSQRLRNHRATPQT